MVTAFSCSKEDDESSSDPEGTMSKTLYSQQYAYEELRFGSARVHLSGSNLVTYNTCEIAYYGQVKGLGGIKKIPQSGWTDDAAATANAGYVVRFEDGTYCRIFISEVRSELYQDRACYMCTNYITFTRYFADVKYQYPFEP